MRAAAAAVAVLCACNVGDAFLVPSGRLALRTFQRGASVGRAPLIPTARAPPRCMARMIFGGSDGEEEGGRGSVTTFFPAVDRIVAVGDVHGDVDALRGCLLMAELIDEDDQWIGGDTHFVQIGDILDRGDEEKDCLDLLVDLKPQAKAAGGAVHILLGNHEVMNADLDFRYVTPGAWDMWGEQASGTLLMKMKERLKSLGYPEYMRGRISAFRPGGHVAQQLADMQIAIQIGENVLVHGGLRKKHVEYGVEQINSVTREWLLHPAGDKPSIIDENDSPVWARLYSTPSPTAASTAELDQVLSSLGAQRMIVGHTPQLKGINCAVTDSGKEVWRCDTGMSKGMMKGPQECIEVLRDGTVHVLTWDGVVPGVLRSPEKIGEFVDVCDIDTGICTPSPEESSMMLAQQPKGGETGDIRPFKDLLDLDINQQPLKDSPAIERLRAIDDESLDTLPRLSLLVEKIIEDAVAADDKTLTKKAIREMLGRVVGTVPVSENQDFIYSTVDKVVLSYTEEAAGSRK
eukprot:CAMPEP_0174951794 /NCGR_PEP_ID=MMETSP1355-20121228/95039_1 /TAXON_ID=464990 /ORGANISM="Hemiselmis tepida, Strain CCMP443" /LENGTH=517 /DNA_ID=CAMNT_0016199471 /DNA_START=211 /DNA_END=1764 /DNA_ORIENTATION=+